MKRKNQQFEISQERNALRGSVVLEKALSPDNSKKFLKSEFLEAGVKGLTAATSQKDLQEQASTDGAHPSELASFTSNANNRAS